MINKIYNEDCLKTMERPSLINTVDLVITSPPYNMTKRKGGYADKTKRYDVYEDWKSEKDYISFILDVFSGYEKVLKKDRCILFNFSYSIENPSLPFQMVSAICNHTAFTVVDTIVWKKPTATPHPASKNRVRRVCEHVYVFTRKEDALTFETNKKYNIGSNGQKYYDIVDNYIEAKNNDGSNELNKATFSTDLVIKLLETYCKKDYLVYDSFMGVGTTAKACEIYEVSCVGSELSEAQIELYKKNKD